MDIDLNCDMGEGCVNDALLMPYISSANIACGYHAGNLGTMQQTISLALKHGVSVGAHPGYADPANFGRTEVSLSPADISELITSQIRILQQVAQSFETRLHHVKPHGALYNLSARNAHVAAAIARAVKATDDSLVVYGLSGSHSITQARKLGLKTAQEIFADRTYQNDGSLTPRTQPGALIDDAESAVQQVVQIIQTETVTTVEGLSIPIKANTVCIHGDGPHAVDFARALHTGLDALQLLKQTIPS